MRFSHWIFFVPVFPANHKLYALNSMNFLHNAIHYFIIFCERAAVIVAIVNTNSVQNARGIPSVQHFSNKNFVSQSKQIAANQAKCYWTNFRTRVLHWITQLQLAAAGQENLYRRPNEKRRNKHFPPNAKRRIKWNVTQSPWTMIQTIEAFLYEKCTNEMKIITILWRY